MVGVFSEQRNVCQQWKKLCFYWIKKRQTFIPAHNFATSQHNLFVCAFFVVVLIRRTVFWGLSYRTMWVWRKTYFLRFLDFLIKIIFEKFMCRAVWSEMYVKVDFQQLKQFVVVFCHHERFMNFKRNLSLICRKWMCTAWNVFHCSLWFLTR